jgi:hypothetical protein
MTAKKDPAPRAAGRASGVHFSLAAKSIPEVTHAQRQINFLERRFRLPPALAALIAEHAFGSAMAR